MRKEIILISIVIVSQIATASAQYKNTDDPDYKLSTANFIRLYPLELIMHEFRMGVELATTPKQAIVLDGSYFWGNSSTEYLTQKQGWALKMDYRFYTNNVSNSKRFFWGPNLMVKQQDFVKESKVYSSRYSTRQVYCVNMKMGTDFQVARNNRSRFEFFCGAGARYQSSGIEYTLFEHGPNHASGSKVLVNVLLGMVLKL
jgi:hypothetical protein